MGTFFGAEYGESPLKFSIEPFQRKLESTTLIYDQLVLNKVVPNQVWDGNYFLEQVEGIGPSLYPWEGHVLPLYDTCIGLVCPPKL